MLRPRGTRGNRQGLGGHAAASRLEIRWPSGALQELTNIKGDRIVEVREDSGPRPLRVE